MKINIIAVGKIKEKYLKEAIDEYRKRLSKFCLLNIIEIDEKVALTENVSNIEKSIECEGKSILSKIKNEYVVAMDIEGVKIDTIEFVDIVRHIKTSGFSEISFIIGGSYGLSRDVKNRAKLLLSFSKMTFPHQLFRVMLLEQIYRYLRLRIMNHTINSCVIRHF